MLRCLLRKMNAIHQAAILRTLEADSRYLRLLHLTEFAVLGALSGLFAATGRLDAGNQSTGIFYLHRSSSSIRASPSDEKYFFAMGALVRSVRCGGNF